MDRIDQLQNELPEVVDVVHVEVCRKPQSTLPPLEIRDYVQRMLLQKKAVPKNLQLDQFGDAFLDQHVHMIRISDLHDSTGNERFDPQEAHLEIHVYQLNYEAPGMEEVEDEEISAAQHWVMPSHEYEGLWDSLVYDSKIKSQLLDYVSTTILLSEKNVDPNIISWNKVVLLHGPPGSGKTSLCKALAQKLCIRLAHKYRHGQLIEINSHSLFSKWFSESGKLVMKMFSKIQELIDDDSALIFVLIDEVESLTAARKSALAGSEPSDAIRVVNALLTQLDQIKRNPNVIILTTSNITGAIDLAFVDRADIKQFIGLPSPAAIYPIYLSCIMELMKVEVITPHRRLLAYSELDRYNNRGENELSKQSLVLRQIAKDSEGLSGRTLRKVPCIALALFVKSATVTLEKYLEALKMAVEKQFQERAELCDAR